MCDSDSDNLTSNVMTFHNENTIISARGPNTNASNITGISFRNNVLTSTMNMPSNFERQYARSNYSQRSMNYRRETSPMSIMSACDVRQRNFNNSYYPRDRRGMSSQRSVFNGRSGSPTSVRSIDTSASCSATVIAMAFKNNNFNKHELRLIKDAYNTYMKHEKRKRIEKRRKLRLFIKSSKRNASDDSGAQGSDSSISSDDRSTRTNYKEERYSCKSTKKDLSHFRKTIKESNIVKDCTDHFRQNSIQSMVNPVNLNNTQTSVGSQRSMIAGSSMSSLRNVPANFNKLQSKQNIPMMLQKERFKTGFLLPSQKFKKSVASSTIPENAENVNRIDRNYLQNGNVATVNKNMPRNMESDSDQDDIFFDASNEQKTKNYNLQRKRSNSDDDIGLPNQKKPKTASPCKNSVEARNPLSKETTNDKTDFVFAKPKFPIKKTCNSKIKTKMVSQPANTQNDQPEQETQSNAQPGNLNRNTSKVNKDMARNIESDSDEGDIFYEVTNNQNTINNNLHRSNNSDDNICLPTQTKLKASHCKNDIKAVKSTHKETTVNYNEKTNEYMFTKPTFPVSKSFNPKTKEKLISKSAVPLSDTLTQAPDISMGKKQKFLTEKPLEQKKNEEEHSAAGQNTTDLSMRPSFIKRKLFTQKLDVVEKKNISTDSLVANSPQSSIYSAIQNEKHKARKLQQVTTQSCLSRDVLQDENNLLDLIHKIVPLEQMNVTNQTNKTDLQSSKNKSEGNEEKWDVTSIITAQKDDENVSDTYTDEEIFNATVEETAKRNCKVVVERLPIHASQTLKLNKENNDAVNKSVRKCIQSFWDTDFESDAEIQPHGNGEWKKIHEKNTLRQHEPPKFQGFSTIYNSKKNTTASTANVSTCFNNTVMEQKFNYTSLRIRSHRTPKRKKVDLTIDEDTKSVVLEPESKKQKTFQARSCIELSCSNSELQTDTKNKQSKDEKQLSQLENKKSPKGTKNHSKSDKKKDFTEPAKELPTRRTNKSKNLVDTNQFQLKFSNEEINNNKQKKRTESSQKSAKKNLNNSKTQRPKEETVTKKQNISNPENKENTKPQNCAENGKSKTKQNNSNKKTTESKAQNKKQSPKIKKNKTTLRNNSSVGLDTTKQDNNKTCRAIKSCRNSELNETVNKSNITLNETMYRSLRSRQIDLSSTSNGLTRKGKPKVNNTKDGKSRLSNISFSLALDKKSVAKRAVPRINSSLFKAKDVETSDVSFSLRQFDSPTPKKAISAKSRVDSIVSKNQNNTKKPTSVKKNVQCKEISVLKNKSKPGRNRMPTKRYLILC